MFNFFKGGNSEIVAPQTGSCVALTEVPDAVFADKVLGDGVAIKPTEDVVFSPINGTIVQVAHTFHAIGIEGSDGIEILLHLGINTVELKGDGFNCHVKVGDKVKKGDKLIDMDRAFIESKGYNTISPCIITNMDSIDKFEIKTGDVKAKENVVISYKKR